MSIAVKTKISEALDRYNTGMIDRGDLILYVTEMFHSCISQRHLTIETIEMYYIMTELIDSDELTIQEFTEEVKRLTSIIQGKIEFRYQFATCLQNENSNEITRLNQIVHQLNEKGKLKSVSRFLHLSVSKILQWHREFGVKWICNIYY